MKRFFAVLLAGAMLVSAQTSVKTATQNQGLEDMASQLQLKLSTALKAAEGECVKAQEAAKALQQEMRGKTEAQKTAVMEQRRAKAQKQLQEAIQNLEKVSAQVAAQVEQTREQIQARLQEKTQELKQMQQKIQSKDGTGSGTGTGTGK
ncbi:MAG TPA: hypothetical protein PLE24_11730 [Chitinispirillaceae bacterium]|jgi:DNA anti-recombination protein RmuC|nr:hypothetical protein [Chitinispirillaceae bacterium]